MKHIIVEDNEDLFIYVKLPPSVNDPAHEYPAMARAFRVVAWGSGPLLELLALNAPLRLTDIEFNESRIGKHN